MEEKTIYYIIGIIIPIVFLILVLSGLVSLKSNMNNVIIDQECWNSIEIHSRLVQATKSEVTPDINCPTKFETIKKSEKEKNVNKEIASAWANCWGNWHRGRVELFNSSGSYCHICNIITFEDRSELKNLYTYLNTYTVPGTQMKYFQYLSPFSTESIEYVQDIPEELDETRKKQLGDYITLNNEDYAIIFFYAKGEDQITKFLNNKRTETVLAGSGLAILGVGVTTVAAAAFASALTAAATTGASLSWTPLGWVILGVTAITAGGVLIYAALTAGDNPQWITFSAFLPYNEETLESLGCDIAPVRAAFSEN